MRQIDRFIPVLLVAAFLPLGEAVAGPCASEGWSVALPGLHIEFESIEGQAWVGGWYGFRKEMREDGCSPLLYASIEASGSAIESIISLMSPSNSIEYSYSGRRYWDYDRNEPAGVFLRAGTYLKCENSLDYSPPPEAPFENEFYSVDSRTEVVSDSERLFEFEGDYRPPCAFGASQSSSFEGPESDPVIARGIRFTLSEDPLEEGLRAIEVQMANPGLVYVDDPIMGGHFPIPAALLSPGELAELFPQPYWAPTASPVAYSSEYIDLIPTFENASPGETAKGVINTRMVMFEARLRTACEGAHEIEEVYRDEKRDPGSACGAEGEWTRRRTVTLSPDPDGSAVHSGSVPVKPHTLTRLVEIRYRRVPDCDKVPGAVSNALGSIRHRLSLGAGTEPGALGSLYLDAGSVAEALQPSALKALQLAEIRDPVDDRLLQAAGHSLIAEVTPEVDGFTVRLYDRAAVASPPGQGNPAFGFAAGAVPVKTIRYQNPDYAPDGSSPQRRFHISEYTGGMASPDVVHEFGFDPALDEWTLRDSRADRLTRRRETDLGGGRRSELETVGTVAGEILSCRERIFQSFGTGEGAFERLVEDRRFRDFDAAGNGVPETALTESFTYQTGPADTGRLLERRTSEGDWERREYPDPPTEWPGARIERVIRPIGNASPGGAPEVNRVTEKVARDASLDGQSGRLYATVEWHAGIQTKREMSFTVEADDLKITTTRRYAEPGGVGDADWGVGPWVETIEWVHAVGPLAGKPLRTDTPDGLSVRRDHHWMIYPKYGTNPVLGTTVESGTVNAVDGDFTPLLRTVTWEGVNGHQRESQTFDLSDGERLVDWVVHTDFDASGRPGRTDYFDGTTETRSYGCCDLEWMTDRTGLRTDFSYFPDGNLASTTSRGIETRTERAYAEDPVSGLAGEEQTTIRRGEDGSEITVARVLIDRTGRIVRASDALGNETRHAHRMEEDGSRVETVTLPDGLSQEVRRFNRDGNLESRTGAAVLPVRYEYGVLPDTHDGRSFTASFEREIRLLPDGSDSGEYLTVWRDMLGRVYKIESPSPDGSGPVHTLRYHDDAGRLMREVDPDGVTRLFAYDALGRETFAALDVDRDGQIDLDGPDEVTRTLVAYEAVADGGDDSIPALARRNFVRTTGGESLLAEEVLLLDRLEVRRAGPGWSFTTTTELAGAGDYLVRAIDGFGVEEVRSYAGGYLESETRVSPDGALSVEAQFTYDAHGRLAVETGRPGQITRLEYHDDDSILRVTGPESSASAGDGRVTEFTEAWDPVGGGFVRTRTLPGGGEAVDRYDARGALVESSGSPAGPFPYAVDYDYAGRLARLTTWQSYPAKEGEVVTEWRYNPAGLLEEKVYDSGGAEEQPGPRHAYTPGGRVLAREAGRPGPDGQPLGVDFRYHLDPGDWSGRLAALDYAGTTPDVHYAYDRLGRVASIDDASGSREFHYVDAGPRTSLVSYLSGPLSGAGISYGWDGDRLVSRTVTAPAGEVLSETYGYDGLGRIVSLANGNLSFQFDRLDGAYLVSATSAHLNDMERMTVDHTHNLRDELVRIGWDGADGASGATAYRRDVLGRRSVTEDAGGRYWVWEYDALGQLSSAGKHVRMGATPEPGTDPAVPGYDFSFLHDAIGNRVSTGINGRSVAWDASRLNQYLQRDVPRRADLRGESAEQALVTIDGAPAARDGSYFWAAPDLAVLGPGAVESEIVVEAVLPDADPATTDPRHLRTVDARLPPNPEIFSHDLDGNLVEDGLWSYHWDEENRLVAVESLSLNDDGLPTVRVEYAYDSQGRRFGRSVLRPDGSGALAVADERLFLFDGWNPAVELARAGQETSYALDRTCLWGPDLGGGVSSAGGVGGLLAVVDNGQTLLPAYDGAGNVVAVLDAASGEIAARFEYGPFGTPLRATGPAASDFPYRFNTKYTDPDTGLLYFGYRHYNPTTARWLSRDPIGEFGDLNLYAFVGNDPVNRFDPLGLDTYAIDGTYANVLDPTTKWRSTNVSDFLRRLDANEVDRYYGGPGVTPNSSRRGGKAWNGATGAETYEIVRDVLRQICSDKEAAAKAGREFKVNLIGWSRGATAAIWIAKELERKGCDCGDGRRESVPVNFLGLYDAVEMIPAGPLIPGHRLPEWLPGDQGPPNSVPSNVQNFFHAQKTGGRFIRSRIPLPTTNFNHPNETGFPTREDYSTGFGRSRRTSNNSDHGQIGVSPSATEAHAEMLNAAAGAGVPISARNPYVHLR